MTFLNKDISLRTVTFLFIGCSLCTVQGGTGEDVSGVEIFLLS